MQVQAPALVLDQQQQQQQQMLSFGHFLNSMYQKFQCNNQPALNLSFTQPGQGQPTGLPLQTGFGQQNNTAQLGQLSLQNGSQTHTAQPGVLALQNGLQNNTAQPAQLPSQNLQQLPPAATVAQGVAPASLELPAQNFPAQQPAESQPKQAEQQQEPAAGLEAFEDENFRKLQEKKTQATAKAKAKAKATAKAKAKAQPKCKAKAKCKAVAKAKSKASSSKASDEKLGCLKCRGFNCEVCLKPGFKGVRLTRTEWLERAKKHGLK